MKHRIRVVALAAVVAVTGVFVGTNTAAGWQGDQDLAFGTNGFARRGSSVVGVAVQSDHSIVAAHDDFSLSRFDTNGQPVGSFGGVANASASALALQSDGKPVAAGWDHSSPSDVVLARWASDGALDNTFGTGGITTINFGASERANAMALQPDGKLVVGGVSDSQDTGGADHYTFLLTRITTNGSVDPTFGSGGRAVGLETDNLGITAVTLGPNGKILAAAKNVVLRFNADGSADTSFGTGGSVVLNTGRVVGLAAQGSETVAASWRIVDSSQQTELTAISPTGTVDKGPYDPPTPGTWGPVALTGLGDGRLVVAGTDVSDSPSAFVIARFNSDFTPDPTFGDDGVSFLSSDQQATANALAIDGAGGYIVAGGLGGTGAVGRVTVTTAFGLVVDDWGGLHPFGVGGPVNAPNAVGGPYWQGQDAVRGVAITQYQQGGYVLDSWGGIHPFAFGSASAPPQPTNGPYWQGKDVARGIALLPDGSGGFVVDDWGGLHPFSVGSLPPPPKPTNGPYWVGQDVVRGVSVAGSAAGGIGYVQDDWGVAHPFSWGSEAGNPPPGAVDGPYWQGQDAARGLALTPFGGAGYVVDAWGGLHAQNFSAGVPSLPKPTGGPYWPGQDVVRGVAISPQ